MIENIDPKQAAIVVTWFKEQKFLLTNPGMRAIYRKAVETISGTEWAKVVFPSEISGELRELHKQFDESCRERGI